MNSAFNRMCVLVLAGLMTTAAGMAQSTSPACNDELIKGNYGFTLEGTKLGGPGPIGPQVGVAMTQFDCEATSPRLTRWLHRSPPAGSTESADAPPSFKETSEQAKGVVNAGNAG